MDVSSHFQFGENWKSYAALVDDAKIEEAIIGLRKLISEKDIRGKTFLDIGCGSGLSMLAALRLGAASVKGVDIDENSVGTARALLSRFAPDGAWSVERQSVFDLTPADTGDFDVVHSWGVLHHTGDMWKAVANAAALVKRNGLLVVALYHKTPLCDFWRAEKRLYAHAGRALQWLIRQPYKALYILRIAAGGKNPWAFIADYKTLRGMDWHHDVHDWLGGYPYESTLPAETVAHLEAAGYKVEAVLENCAGGIGLLGTGCDEFTARRL